MTQVLLGACLGALVAAVCWIFVLTRQIARFETERSVLFDRLLIKNGQAPMTFLHEEVVKVPDIEAVPAPNLFDELYEQDYILEEAERIRPSYKGMTLDEIKGRDPGVYAEAVRAHRNNVQHLRV